MEGKRLEIRENNSYTYSDNAIIYGNNCDCYGKNCQIYGDGCKVYGEDCVIFGNNCVVYGERFTNNGKGTRKIKRPVLDERKEGKEEKEEKNENIRSRDLTGTTTRSRIRPPVFLLGSESKSFSLDLKKLGEMKDIETDSQSECCTVCMVNKRIVMFQCGHKRTCAGCTIHILQQNAKCPHCREEIKFLFRAYD